MFPNGSTAKFWPRVIGNGGGVNDAQKSPGMSGLGHVRSARRPPEFVIAKSVAVRRPHRVGDDVRRRATRRAGRRRARTSRSAESPAWTDADLTLPEDRRERRVQLVDLRLDRRVRRDADVPRLVVVGGLVDDLARVVVHEQADAGEPEPLAAVLGHEHPVRPRRVHLDVVVVADHDVDAD